MLYDDITFFKLFHALWKKIFFFYILLLVLKSAERREKQEMQIATQIKIHRRSPEFQGMPECVDDHSKGKIK